MKTIAPRTRTIATVDTFDGVHRGHVYLLEQLQRKADRLGRSTWVMALERPAGARNTQPSLTSTEERLELLRPHADTVSLLELDSDDYSLTGTEFLATLKERYGVEAFVMGFNNHIGRDHAGAADLAGACMPVFEAQPLEGEVSSTAVRRAIAEGRLSDAADMLGRPYSIHGTVGGGRQLGRTIGFPTANIEIEGPQRMLPPTGVYAASVRLDGDTNTHHAVVNIGYRPTIDAEHTRMSIEAHILDFNSDIYGRTLTVAFAAHLRSEQRFGSLKELRAAIAADCGRAREILS